MSVGDLVLNLVLAVVAAVIGWWTALYFFRRGTARRRVEIGLHELAHLDPGTLGVQVQMRIGTHTVSNLYVLEISVTNRGPNDVLVRDAADPEHQRSRPRVALPPDLRVITDPWVVDGTTDGADVRVARSLQEDRQWLYIHVHRLAAGSGCAIRVVCTHRGEAPVRSIDPEAIDFHPGFLEDVTIEPTGLLRGRVRSSR